MDVAGTFFAIFMTILLALHDKSVSFHFAKNLDLDELDFFKLTVQAIFRPLEYFFKECSCETTLPATHFWSNYCM